MKQKNRDLTHFSRILRKQNSLLRSRLQLLSPLVICLMFLFSFGCQSNDVTLKAVEIDFYNVKTLKEGDWIEIDGVRFRHVQAYETVEDSIFTLPASRITRAAKERGTDATEPFPSFNIGYMLAVQINSINKDSIFSVNHQYTYRLVDPDLVLALGKVRFIRSDSTKVHIRTSSDYPAPIREISIN